MDHYFEMMRDCSDRLVELVDKQAELGRVNELMLLNAILMGVVVGVGAYAPRYRRHPLIGFFFLGASTLFLPIVSYVASTTGKMAVSGSSLTDLHVMMRCTWGLRVVLVVVWTGLVLVIGINTSAIVAGDAREGRNNNPPAELFIKAFWLAYLTFSTPESTYGSLADGAGDLKQVDAVQVVVQLLVIIFTKLLFKLSAFYKARRSFALGRSPRLVAGYMAQLQKLGQSRQEITPSHHADDQRVDDEIIPPPALLVMEEDTVNVEEQPHGYSFIEGLAGQHQQVDSGTRRKMSMLVTLDKVWRHSDENDTLLRSQPCKDLCFSFALFKLLRCRFANYTVSEAGFVDTHKFFRDTWLHGEEYGRVFRVIADELSFTHDYYYSSLPISYSHHLFPILSIALSLCSIGYCLYLVQFITRAIIEDHMNILCLGWCKTTGRLGSAQITIEFPATFFEIPVVLVLAVLVLAEIRDIVSYICSNWTKVYLICHYVNHASWQLSPTVQKRIGYVVDHCRADSLVNSWADKMDQCSILPVHHPWKVSLLLRRLFHLPNQKKIKVPNAVKEAIFKALKDVTSEQERFAVPTQIRPPSPPIPSGDILDSPRRTASTILVWHIATNIFEVSHPPQLSEDDPERRHRTAAVLLSRYCAYLVAFYPELLPGDDEWCKKLYRDVSKDAHRALGAAPKAEYQQLVQLLTANSKHEVLKDGATLGKQLVDSGTEWEALALFWSEMMLFVAPSDNLEGHAEAIARGGELITLLWTLLAHAGIVGRLDSHRYH